MSRRVDLIALPLLPLQTVLFPGGWLRLKVFETRYLDLVSRCLRDDSAFAVVCLRQGSELHQPAAEAVQFETIGVLVRLLEVDAEQAGILKLSCLGGVRVRISAPRQHADGLWLAGASRLRGDDLLPPAPELAPAVSALAKAIESMKSRGQQPFRPPHRLNDAGWVANRWCEILPISLAAKQRLMELDEPALRLKLVDDFLRAKGLV